MALATFWLIVRIGGVRSLYSSCASPSAVAMAAATECSDEIQLKDLINKEAARTAQIELIVTRSEIISYACKSRTVKSEYVYTQKLQTVLLSRIGEQYCLGVAKLKRNDAAELDALQFRFRQGTAWKFSRIKLVNEKRQFIHTPCRFQIDLRTSDAQSMLQCVPFPLAPVPTCTIADVFMLKHMQRFDLMAIPAEVMDERRSDAGMPIVDVRLVDGSARPVVDGAETRNAAMPLTIFFDSNAEYTRFEEHVGRKPVVFMCLSVSCNKSGTVQVSTVKDLTRWQEGAGDAYDIMAQKASDLCNGGASLEDVASLRLSGRNEAADYINPPATLSACGLLAAVIDLRVNIADVLGGDTEHLYQLNHVHVQAPTKTDSITTSDGTRLFAQFNCVDFFKSVPLWFRSKAMLQLAQLADGQDADYLEHAANDGIRHPLLCSLRVRVRTRNATTSPTVATEHSQGGQASDANGLSIIVVEAAPYTTAYTPNDSVDAIHGLLACQPKTSDRIAASRLNLLSPSPFYNMLANGEPADKALVLLYFPQASNGKRLQSGFRVVTDRVQDAANSTASEVYSTVALCTVEKSSFFTATKGSTFLALVSKVQAPEKPGHTALLCIEAMDPVHDNQKTETVNMLQKLEDISQFNRDNAVTSDRVAWQQRKCRRLQRYPTYAT